MQLESGRINLDNIKDQVSDKSYLTDYMRSDETNFNTYAKKNNIKLKTPKYIKIANELDDKRLQKYWDEKLNDHIAYLQKNKLFLTKDGYINMPEARKQLSKDPENNIHLAQAFERKLGTPLYSVKKDITPSYTTKWLDTVKNNKKVKVEIKTDKQGNSSLTGNVLPKEPTKEEKEMKDKAKNEFLSMQQAINDMKNWADTHKDSYTGFVQGGWSYLTDLVGATSKDEATFRQNKEMIIGPITKAIYGGHASDKDRQNIVDAMPKFIDNDETFKAKLNAIYTRAKKSLGEKIKTWETAGYDVTPQIEFYNALSLNAIKDEQTTKTTTISETQKDEIFNEIF
jgi:hypothetical protein